jgi:hypothetical protein
MGTAQRGRVMKRPGSWWHDVPAWSPIYMLQFVLGGILFIVAMLFYGLAYCVWRIYRKCRGQDG